MNYGNIYNERVMGYKGMYAPKENKLSISIDTGYENVQKAEMSPFTTVNEYLRLIMDSEMLDYSRLEKS